MSISLVASRKIAENKRIYHKDGCIYAKRIKLQNREKAHLGIDEDRVICNCSYCGGLKGDIRVRKGALDDRKKYGLKYYHDKENDTFCITTDIGFWKLVWKENLQKYFLYHKNVYDKDMSMDELINGKFHRQIDVKPTDSLIILVNYIYAHDRSKVIIADDYRKLPHDTKRQKKYYRCAERKEKRKQAARVDSIFRLLEKNNADYRKLSCC